VVRCSGRQRERRCAVTVSSTSTLSWR
jgi:hypothetical protein